MQAIKNIKNKLGSALGLALKRNRYFSRKISIFFLSFFASFLAFSEPVIANPQGGQVVAGDATITQSSNKVQINQTSNKAIINWQTFNINKNESTHFQQPNGGIALNRIDPTQGASQIHGHLTATGQIILINPAGVYFGPSAYVNVGGLIATTSNISDRNFLNGQYQFEKVPGYSGAVINEGQIIAAQNGLVALVAPAAINNGMIEAHVGKVVLASGEAFTMDFAGDNLINFSITKNTSSRGIDKDGNELHNGVDNRGAIIADGGKVLIAANAVGNVLDKVINLEGVVQARSISQNGKGEIILSGDPSNGVVRVAGKLNASGKNPGEKGGKIHITGHNILLEGAELDVSGDLGGGEVLIGGDYQGHGSLPNANAVVMDSASKINADALSQGQGGKVILWSDNVTKYYGHISVKGIEGNGGLVETSGKGYLEAMGDVDASSLYGRPGVWLLDPANVTISAAATVNGLFDGGLTNTFTTTANNAVANVATIIASLNLGTSVTILTTPGGTQAGDITVSSAILKSLGATTPTLTLTAAGAILVNNNITATSGGLNVVFTGSSVTLGNAASSTITTNGGNFSATVQNGFAMGNGANTGTINTGSGTSTINVNQDGAGATGFSMTAGSAITTTNSTASAVVINVNAAGGGTGTAALRDITTGSGGSITVATNTGGNTTGGSITMPSGTLNVGNTGTITLSTSQTAAVAIGTSALNIQMLGGSLAATTGSGGLFVTNSGTGGLNLGTINTTGAFSLTSTSSTGITDSGTQTVAGILTMVAGATQDITLDSAANNFGTATITSANNVSLLDTNALVLGASTISGNYNITAGGTITQTGALTITGTPTFTLTGATTDLSLASQANNFSTTPIITNNGNVRDLLLRNTNASAVVPTLPIGMRNLTLTFNNAAMVFPTLALTGTLTATANGAITQTGALTGITTGTFAAGAANNITLNNASNNFTTFAGSGNNINVADVNALDLGATTANGTLDVTTSGALTDSGAVIVTGLTKLSSGAANSITLNTATNNFSSVNVLSANAVTLVDTNALDIAGLTSAGAVSLTTNGALTQSGVITAGGTTTLAAGAANNITLNNAANNFTTVAVTSGKNVSLADTNAVILGTSTVSGTYSMSAGSSITQSGILTINNTPTFTVTGANSDISLASQANNFSTTPVITNNGNVRDLHLRNTNAAATVPTLPTGLRNLTLTFNNATSLILPALTLTGNLSVTDNGAITQSGALVVNGSGATATFVAGAANSITLNNASNDFATVAITSGNNVDINDINALILGATTASGTLNVTTNGALTQTGTILATAGLTTLSAGSTNNITLATSTNNFSSIKVLSGNNVSLRDTNAMVVNGINAAGTLTLQTNGTLTQSNTIVATGLTTLIAGAANNITLNNASNNFSTVTVTSGNNVNLADLNALILGAATVSGTLNVAAGGSITQSGALTVTSTPTFTVNTANSDILLSTQANNFATTPVITNNGNVRDLGIRNINASAVVPALPTGLRNLTLTFNAAAMAIPSISLSGALTATATGAITQTGAIRGTSLVAKTLNNAGAAITLANASNDFSSIDLRARNAADSANAAGAISYSNANGFNVANISTTSTINLIGGGNMTQSGAMAGTTLTAKTLNNAGASITFLNAANALTTINLSSRNAADTANAAGMISYRDSNALDIASLATTDSTNIIATSLTQSGAMTVNNLVAKTLNNAGGVITFNNAANSVNSIDLRVRNAADTANAAGAINFVNAGSVNVATIATASTANVTAMGAITDSGNITATTLTTNSVGGTILDFGHNLTGFNAINSSSGNIQLANTGALSITGVTLSGGGNLIINNTGTLTITGTLNIGNGDVSITSTGAISDSTAGAVISTNLLALKTLANAGAAITLDNVNLHNVNTVNLQARNAADTANAAGAISFRDITGFDVAQLNTTSTATLLAGGAMTQSGAMTGSTLTATTLNNTGSDITFNNSSNLFTNINLQTRNAANSADMNGIITYQNSGALNISGLRTLSNANINSGGALTDSGNSIVGNTFTASAVGGILLDSAGNQFNTIDLSNSSSGAITLLSSTSNPLMIAGFNQGGNGTVSITNTGSLDIADGVSINSNNANIGLTSSDLILNNTGSINSGNANVTITQNTASSSIGLGNATGGMTISGSELQRITANNLIFTSGNNGSILVDGVTVANSNNANVVTLNATTGALGSITFQNNDSFFRGLIGNADNGIIVNSALIISNGLLTLNADVNGSVSGSEALTLNADLTASGAISLSSLNGGIVLTSPIDLVANGITINHAVTGAYPLIMNAGSGTARIDNTVSVANLTVTGAILALNGGTITTTSSQIYNGLINLGVNTTMTGSDITFNNDLTGARNLTLIGQAGDNHFAFNSPLGLSNISINGSLDGNNTLTLKIGSFENWLITGFNQGSIGVTGVTGNFDFDHIQNLIGGNNGNTFTFNNGGSISGTIDGSNINMSNTLNYGSYSNPLNVILANTLIDGQTKQNSNIITNFFNMNHVIGNYNSVLELPDHLTTLTFTDSSTGFVVGSGPMNFSRFNSFVSLNNSSLAVFLVPSIYNVATNELTVNGVVTQMLGYKPSNFSGDITIINNNVVPVPPVSPVIISSSVVSGIVSPFSKGLLTNATVDLGSINIVNEMGTQANGAINTAAGAGQIMGLGMGGITPFMLSHYDASMQSINNPFTLAATYLPMFDDLTRSAMAFLLPSLFFLTVIRNRKEKLLNLSFIKEEKLLSPYKVENLSFKLRTNLNEIIGLSNLLKMGPHATAHDAGLTDYILSESENILNHYKMIESSDNEYLNNQDLSKFSFEARTALTNIIGYSELIRNNQKISKKKKKYIKEILKCANDILNLIPSEPVPSI